MNDPTLPPPSSRRITWPDVAMRFVDELPVLAVIGAGCVIAGLQLAHGQAEEPAQSMVGSALVAALLRRRRATIEG